MPHVVTEPKNEPPRTVVRRLVGAAAVGGLALGTGVLGAAPAFAHDVLLSTTPEDDARVTEPLDEVILEFSGDGLTTGEGITNEIRVNDEDGENLAGETEVDGPTMSTQFEEPLPDGEYDVVYRVVYSDGHDEEGTLSFTVDAGIEAAEDEAGADEGGADEGDAEQNGADQNDAEQNDAEQDTAEADGAGQNDAEQDTAEADGAQDPVSEEGDASGWLVVLLGIGGVLIVVLALVMMRRKANQVEDWKQGRRDPQKPAGKSPTDDHPEDPDRP